MLISSLSLPPIKYLDWPPLHRHHNYEQSQHYKPSLIPVAECKKKQATYHSHICCLYINAHEVQTQLMQLMHNVFSLPSGTYIELICFTHLSWLYCDVT